MSSSPEIFFSYAWGDGAEKGDSREKWVNELYESLSAGGYRVVRDKYDLGYKGFISDFMKRIGEGKAVVVVISKKYVRSPYCMFELYEIARNSNFDKQQFREKVLPVMVEPVDVSRPAVVQDLRLHWESRCREWETLIANGLRRTSVEEFERFKRIQKIQEYSGQLMQWMADMNTLTPGILSANDFAEIKKELDRMAAKPAVEDNPQNESNKPAKDSGTTGSPKFIINNEGAKIGQQNTGANVNNSGAGFTVS